ncbi:MAG: penicillin acylase family protein [Gemmatimonadota bacterium]
MNPFSRTALLLSALAAGRAVDLIGQAGPVGRGVTIYRDTWGIPHVFGPTDAGAAFGFGYAQAEDNFPRIETNYLLAIGRAAEAKGERSLPGDRLNRTLEIPRLAREEYARLDPHMRGIVDGFAAGINHYLATHPAVRPELLARMEPWFSLAFIRFNYYQNGFVFASGIRPAELELAAVSPDERLSQGSNGWVISPSHSANGHALLFINPHLSWFGSGQVYEGHVHSDEGWNFTGYTRYGFPFPYVGHNASLGWVSTDNAADLADLYAERFEDSKQPLAYRYGAAVRQAREWSDSIGVKVGDKVEWRRFTFRKTHHGPIIGRRDGKALAVRMARFEADGWLREWYDMTKAQTVSALERAMAPLAMSFGNVMAADRRGNTYYLYNGAVPRRSPQFNWTEPVDGSNPETEWRGYHTIAELPRLMNPPSGWMQNCNTSPFLLTDTGNLDPASFPRYMVQEGDNPRGKISRKILAADKAWSFESLRKAAFDTRVGEADSLLPVMLAGIRAQDTTVPSSTWGRPLDTLRAWNGRSDAGSVATTLFVWWRNATGFQNTPSLNSFVRALSDLEDRFGTWQVPWGEISRLQRYDERSEATFSDSRPSLPLPAMSGRDGSVFTAYAGPSPGQKRIYGVAGGTYVSVVEFGPTVRAVAVHTFGASGDPASPHFFDQAQLFSKGELRPAWFTLEEIKQHLESSYRPAER